MAIHPTPDRRLVPKLRPFLRDARGACAQERVWVRLELLVIGLLTSLGRHTLSQCIVTLGAGDADWSAWYRLFSTPRVAVETLQRQVVAAMVGLLDRHAPLAVALDATHLPRTGRRMPGTGWTPHPRCAPWKRGIHRAQRWVGLNGLLPRSDQGDSRAVPLRWVPAPTPKATPLPAHPPITEWAAGVALLAWLRATLDRLGQTRRRVLAVADGSYSGAGLWKRLPPRTTVLARCAKNRALFALPPDGGTDRRRKYGVRLPTPQQYLHERTGWSWFSIMVRGRSVRLRARVVGPVLVKPASGVPLYLLVVGGVKASRSHRQRQPTSLLVNARQDRTGAWVLPYAVEELLSWAWQRWEVEVLHRELKSGFGLGQQQAWSDHGAVATTQWVGWVYAIVVLAGYGAWGYAPPPGTRIGGWHTPRRWSLGMLWQQLRTEVWELEEMRPVFARSPGKWAGMSTWIGTQVNAGRGYRRI